jgi:glycine betaine/proline transport system substrate-binding protein
MISDVDLNGKKVEVVVAQWISSNKARWSQWLK